MSKTVVTANQAVLGLRAGQTVEVENTDVIKAHVEAGFLSRAKKSDLDDGDADASVFAAVSPQADDASADVTG